jgi:hypothetical protein
MRFANSVRKVFWPIIKITGKLCGGEVHIIEPFRFLMRQKTNTNLISVGINARKQPVWVNAENSAKNGNLLFIHDYCTPLWYIISCQQLYEKI